MSEYLLSTYRYKKCNIQENLGDYKEAPNMLHRSIILLMFNQLVDLMAFTKLPVCRVFVYQRKIVCLCIFILLTCRSPFDAVSSLIGFHVVNFNEQASIKH